MSDTEKIIGLDLGTNSIGWAIRALNALENQIVDKGVIIFNEGVAYEKGVEQPKVQVRTTVRGKRRNYQAEKYRKWELLECLIERQMCPLTIEELNMWRHYDKGTGRRYPQSEIFHQWLRFDFDGDGKPDFERFGFKKHENCYLYRWLAVSVNEDHKKLFANNPMLLGRVLYQMVQRRGFKTMDSEDPETTLIEKGRENPITHEIEVVGIQVIDQLIKKYKTLGAALYQGQKNNELETINNNRIRNRFTYRKYFEDEVDAIFENLGLEKSSEFCRRVKNAIIWQRPLRSQKGLVGYCTLDTPLKSGTGRYYKPGKKRIALSHPLYEEYRTWCFINNLKIEAPQGIDRIKFLHDTVFPMFNRSSDFYFSDKKDKKGKVTKGLKSKIEETGAKVLANYDKDLETDDDGTRYNANTFQNLLEKIFGKEWKQILKWDETQNNISKNRTYLRVEDIWHLFFDAIVTQKQTENIGKKLIPILKKHFPDIEFEEKHFEKISLDKGYASLSEASIKKILPYLKQGMIYSQAVFISNLDKVFGKKLEETEITNFTNEFNQIIKRHKADKEIYRVVNDLISDRLYQRDRLGMGDNYLLDELDRKDIDEKIKDTFKWKNWNKKTDEQKREFIESVSSLYQSFLQKPVSVSKSKLFYKIYRIESELKKLLIEKYNADPSKVKANLWHPSEQEKYPPAFTKTDALGNILKDENGKEILFLGDPNPISRGFKNPMAMRTLHELKKLLNYLLRVGKIDADTKVVVEIARELNDANRRKAIQKWQNENRRKRDGFRKKIEEYFDSNNTPGKAVTENLLDRYELWNEQSEKCLYCGQPIQCLDVLNGTAQLEHTIPAKISNCDELFNFTLAHQHCNTEKAKRFPTQWKERHPAILENIKFIYAKYKSHEEIYKATFDAARQSTDKNKKDLIIQKRHIQKLYLDYWRKKYETFTITEVTNQFRRQQLTDTQIITKYSLPYLRTVFNRVDVQKGIVTDKFRKIYNIEPRKLGKDRTEHSHHTIDAAVLTLIPPASIRDNMMKEYNEAVDNNTLNIYKHPSPKNWENFHQSYIFSLKGEIIANCISNDRTLKQSFKYKRKRGEIVRNKNGNRIILKGDTVRGKLHDESIFGMIKMPETEFKDGKHRLKIVDKRLSFKQNEKRKDELFVVKKIPITDITNVEDFEKMVIDPNLGSYLKKEVERRIQEDHLSLERALRRLYAFGITNDKNGNPLQPIRHLRCKVKTGEDSYLQFPASIKPIEKAFESKRQHKQTTYANNAETPVCAIYEWSEKGEIKRELKPITILEMSNAYHFADNHQLIEKQKIEIKGTGKNKREIIKPLSVILRKKQHVIFYKEGLAELKELYETDKVALSKRIYRVLKFEDGKIFFDYHLTSLSDTEIIKEMEKKGLPKKGDSKINYETPTLRLRLSQASLNMAVEGKHFDINLDGTINFQNIDHER